jgi:hypothetical protein
VNLLDFKTRKLIDLETRKSVHTSMTRVTHTEFRKILFDYSLSMQEVFERFAFLVGENDSAAMCIIEELSRLKREKILDRLNEREAENLYDVISEVNPLEKI